MGKSHVGTSADKKRRTKTTAGRPMIKESKKQQDTLQKQNRALPKEANEQAPEYHCPRVVIPLDSNTKPSILCMCCI